LADWIRKNEVGPDKVITDPATDCVQRAWDAFHVMHNRRANATVDDGVLSDAGLPGLLSALGGIPAPVDDPDMLWQAISQKPHAMALVVTRSLVARPRDQRARDHQGHGVWLLADRLPQHVGVVDRCGYAAKRGQQSGQACV